MATPSEEHAREAYRILIGRLGDDADLGRIVRTVGDRLQALEKVARAARATVPVIADERDPADDKLNNALIELDDEEG